MLSFIRPVFFYYYFTFCFVWVCVCVFVRGDIDACRVMKSFLGLLSTDPPQALSSTLGCFCLWDKKVRAKQCVPHACASSLPLAFDAKIRANGAHAGRRALQQKGFQIGGVAHLKGQAGFCVPPQTRQTRQTDGPSFSMLFDGWRVQAHRRASLRYAVGLLKIWSIETEWLRATFVLILFTTGGNIVSFRRQEGDKWNLFNHIDSYLKNLVWKASQSCNYFVIY